MSRIYLWLWLLGYCCLSNGLIAQQPTALWLRQAAISPDGQSIVFSYRGDLYRVPAMGGQAYPLTLHEAYDGMPVWSPDGKSIAFASDRYGNFDIFVMPATGGEAKRLTFFSRNDIPYSFAPDGKSILFQSLRTASKDTQLFVDFAELYRVSASGGQARLVQDVPMEMAQTNAAGTKIAYHDFKGYEDPLRKHHTSSVARDVWVYDLASKRHTQLTTFAGEDRNPVWRGDDLYYLSEQSGSFNIFRININTPAQPTQITRFTKHPIRHLSIANTGTLCFLYDGEIYTKGENAESQKLNIQILNDSRLNPERITPINGGASEIAVSPNGKEIAVIVRGEVFVTSVEGGITKRITNTPEQERSVSFSPDGKSILYAAERNNNWNIYQTKMLREGDLYFFASTLLAEEEVIATDKEEFQPAFSPDGKEVAYLEERTTLRVINLASKAVRTIVAGDRNYSYADGDQSYDWSPDGKWFALHFLPTGTWTPDVGLVRADGKGDIINLTQSGYSEYAPRWMHEGKMLVWSSDRHGMRSHGSWGSQDDIIAVFLTQEAYDRYRLSETDFKLLKEREEKDKEKKDEPKKDDKNTKKDEPKKDETKPLNIELAGIADRKVRLTIHSAAISDALVSKDGEKLFYLARFESSYDLWTTNLRTKETRILLKDAGSGGLVMSKDGKNLFVLAGGRVNKVDVESGSAKGVDIAGEMNYNYLGEKAYIYDHAWRQTLKKFYKSDMHGVDWQMYYHEYKKFLPHIHHNYDFAEMLSELLGELNASHTGARFRMGMPNSDQTASLGVFYDENYAGKGVKIAEIMPNSPLAKAGLKIRVGHIIEKIDGIEISPEMDFYQLLNRKAGKYTLLSMYDEANKSRYEETVKPITLGEEYSLLYKRWVESRRALVDRLSGGKVGYVHIESMDDPSFRVVFEEVLGKNHSKDALIVDTRSNGGGWLHDDLVYFLGGKAYSLFRPRGQNLGTESQFKWTKPSCVLMGEDNYSDAHIFPFAYKTLGIGKLIGMPVPGTGTAVWWESQIDPTLVFGIPQVGNVTLDGQYLENLQLEPDIKVKNDPESVQQGRDLQLERAVEEMLKVSKK